VLSHSRHRVGNRDATSVTRASSDKIPKTIHGCGDRWYCGRQRELVDVLCTFRRMQMMRSLPVCVCVCVRVCARGNAYACTRACAYCVQNRQYRQRRGATYACPGLKSAQCVHKRLRYSLRRPVLELGHASLIREKRLRLKCRTVRVPLFLPWDNFQSLSRMLHTDIRNAAVRA